jgi:drug/metabolite transporter (DMT)-like permease
MQNTKSNALSPLILACLAATWFVWGSTYLAIKFSLESFPPFFGMGTRFITAGVLLAVWMAFVKKTPWPTALQWRNALVIGALMLAGGMGATAYSEQSVSSGLVVAFIAVCPVLMAAGNALWKIYPSKLEIAGMAFGVAGVLMLTQGAGLSASPIGLIAISIACVSWTVGSLLNQREPRLALAPGAMGLASEMILGGIVLIVFAAVAGEFTTVAAMPAPTPRAIASWAYLVVFGSLIAFNAYMILLARASAALASSYCFVNPIIAMLLGIACANEKVTGFEWFAAGVVLLGVVLTLRGRAR